MSVALFKIPVINSVQRTRNYVIKHIKNSKYVQ